jgi:two-component system phosphate regulon sensor histidine kinase PhoR
MGTINTDQEKALSVAQRAADELGNLIEDLVLFSSTKDRPLKLRMQMVSVSSLFESAMSYVRGKAEKAGIRVNLDCPSACVSVLANPDRLSWVIRHLAENAIKYNKRNGSITLSVREEDDSVRFAVDDTGIGIPEEYFEEIFEPFRQLDDAMDRRYGGMGLGLNLVRKIVRAHGTDVSLSSEVGKGSSFSFRLQKA